MKKNVEQILNCLVDGTMKAGIFILFALEVRKKHPEIWKEFLKEHKIKDMMVL